MFQDYALKGEILERASRKWLDYLGYALTGSDGTLSQFSNIQAVACDLDASVAPGDVYYFHASGDIVFVDPDILTTKSSHSSQAWDSGFRDALVTRDGMCPSRRRGLHGWMGTGPLGFLQTPTRSLKSSDIHEGAEPDAYHLTIHVFLENSNSRQSYDHYKAASLRSPLPDDWPPEVIFTFLYGGAVLWAWGPKPFPQDLYTRVRRQYYPEGLRTRGLNKDGEARAEEERRKKATSENERADRAKKRSGESIDGQDMIMALWSIFHDKAMERAKETAESKSKQRSTEKVTSWLDDQ
ncbi:hypothetical protein DFH11DRAFT_1545785 [Phellopilus nigrolimitatus]|nr:hypothetical protein DFH11DRAFT_1545785 [Phellopilus nigrolimitatus]